MLKRALVVGMISYREPRPGRWDGEDELVSKLYKKIQNELSPQDFETWFSSTPCSFRSPNSFILWTRNNFHHAWIKKKYSDLLLGAARSVCNFEPLFTFEIGESKREVATGVPQPISSKKAGSERTGRRPSSKHTASGLELSQPTHREYTFENFVVGKGSNVAHAASLAVTEQPGSYNPLQISGEVGVGKTHLLQAIYHQLALTRPNLRTIYVNAETFTNQYILAAQQRELDTFRQRSRSAEVLLLDDLQFLSAKSKTQEEFLHTFQYLLERNRQVVITSNCPPSLLKDINSRLTACFDGGLVAHLGPADFETRLLMLYRKATLRGYELPAETARFLAGTVTGNLRELDGALTHLISRANHHEAGLTVAMAERGLNEMLAENKPRSTAISVDAILQLLEDYFGVKQKELLSNSKVRSLVYARQMGMYLARELTPYSLAQIGLRFGGKDHSTVLYAQSSIKRHMKTKPQVHSDLKILRSRLTCSNAQ